MGIGQHAFEQFVDAVIGGRVRADEQAVRGDYFVNRRLGLGFVKPRAWHFRAFEDFYPVVAGQRLEGDLYDEQEELADHAATLVAVVSKYPIEEACADATVRFSPSITIFSNSEDRSDLPADLATTVALGIEYFGRVLRDYVILEPPHLLGVSSCPAARYTAEFVFEHRAMQPTRVRDQTLMIDQGTRLYTIHLYDSPATGERIVDEFTAFVGSLHLA